MSKFPKSEKSSKLKFFFVIFGASLAFDDIGPLAKIGGPFLAAPTSLFALIFFLNKEFFSYKNLKNFRKLYFFILYSLSLSLFYSTLGPIFVFGESLEIKLLKNFLQFLLYLFVVWIGINLDVANPSKKVLGIIGWSLYLTTLLGLIFSKYLFKDLDYNSFFHFTLNSQLRVRGFRFEASSLGSAFLISTCMIIFNKKNFQAIFTFIILLLVPVFLVSSRGLVLTFFIILILYILRYIYFKIFRFRSIYFVIEFSFIISVSYGLIWIIGSNLWIPFSQSTSDTTRVFWGIVPFFMLMQYPLGVGFGNSFWAVPIFSTEHVLPFMTNSLSSGGFNEISALIYGSTDKGFAPKTLPSLLVMYFGVIGVVIIFFYLRKLSTFAINAFRNGNVGHYISVMCLLITTCSYYGSTFAWDQALLFGFILNQANQQIIKRDFRML